MIKTITIATFTQADEVFATYIRIFDTIGMQHEAPP